MARRARGGRQRGYGARAVALGAALGAIGGVLAVGAHFARRVLTPARVPEESVVVLGFEDEPSGEQRPDYLGRRVRIQGQDCALPGAYSFISDEGASHARLGPVLSERVETSGRTSVLRGVVAEDRGWLRVGARGRVTGWWYTDPAELGFASSRVSIPLEGGMGWAWLVEPDPATAQPGRWAVHVHGRGALPEETLRGVAPAARAGLTSLVIAYRNDPGAPRGLRGRYGLGLAERRDVDAAIAWAREHGAERVTLFGWSMGGTASLLAATRGPLRRYVDGLVLDSPAIDWRGLLRAQAELAHAPAWVGDLARRLLQRGYVHGAVPGERGTDLSALTPEAFAPALRVPVLIHASPDDTYVPWAGAQQLARLRPELVALREGRGEHVKLWNVDPDAWESETEAFVRQLPPPPLK